MINVSVVIPAFGVQKYLSQCLDSIVNQSLSDIQVILLSDGTEETTGEIVQEFSKNNSNVVVMPHFSLDQVMGEYVLFLSPDDSLDETMLEHLFKKAKTTKSDIVYCDFENCNNLSVLEKSSDSYFEKTGIPKNHILLSQKFYPNFFHLFPCINGCFLYHRKFLEQYFETLFPKQNDIDTSFLMKSLVLSNKTACLDIKLVNHHAQKKGIWGQGLLEQFEDVLEFLEHHKLFQFEDSFISRWLDLLSEQREELFEPERSLFDIQVTKKILFSLLNKNNNRLVHPLSSLLRRKNLSDSFEKVLNNTNHSVIPIVIPIASADDAYGASVTIQSVSEHINTDYFYDIYILHAGNLKKSLKMHLEDLTRNEMRVTCVNIEKELLQDASRSSNELFLTHLFFLPNMFSYEKVLYLKPQVIVQKDISELFNLDISDHILAGCLVHGDINYAEKTLGLVYENFINTDVLFINLGLWKKGDYTQKCLDTFLVPPLPYRVPVRDIINTVFQDYIYILDEKYNGQYRLISEEKYSEENCYLPEFYVVINYDSQKPWIEPEEEWMEIWWDYAKKSPLYELILYRNISKKKLTVIEEKQPKDVMIQEEKPLIANLSQIPFQEQKMYLLLKNYVGEFFKYGFSWGKNKRVHKENLQKITKEIHKLCT